MHSLIAQLRRIAPSGVLAVFILAGAMLINATLHAGKYSPETDNYNLMWLDAWNLAFIGVIIYLWRSSHAGLQKNSFILISVTWFGVVALSLIFSEAMFPVHAYWGDQKFRMTMIEQFMSTSFPSDYYYKDLPVFYPPVLYYFLSVIARLFHLEAYQVLRIAPHILFLGMPLLLYGLWRNILSAPRALFVVCAVMLVDVGGFFFLAKIPHAFVANNLFIPWWLYYLEGIHNNKKHSFRFWLSGSIVGVLLFSTYFYPYFIIALLLPLQTIVAVLKKNTMRLHALLRGWGVLCGAALFSLPHWLPVFLSIAKYGADRSRGDWYTDGTAGLNFSFLTFSWIGICFLLALLYFLYRSRSKLYQQFLAILATILLFTLIGSVLGAFDISLNLTKVRDFVVALGAAAIGLGFYTLFRWSRHTIARRRVVTGVIAAFLFITVQGTTALFREPTVLEAKKTAIPNWGIPKADVAACSHAVFLSGNEEFFAFFPAYSFIAINEHYSHPASRFIQRYDFLNLLQRVRDPYVFNVALRHNIFDPVDYVLPDRKGDSFTLHASISNYPDKLESKTLTYPCSMAADSRYFRQLVSERYILNVLTPSEQSRPISIAASSARDSAQQLNDLCLLADRLDSTGQQAILPAFDSLQHLNLFADPKGYWYEDRLVLVGCHAFTTRDSVYLFPTFRVNRSLTDTWRIFLHLYTESQKDSPINVDFPVDISTQTWAIGDLITLCRAFPKPDSSFSIVMGFFNKNGEYGKAFAAKVPNVD